MTGNHHTDSSVYKQKEGFGNCMQCAVAYYLGIPLAKVPDFAAQKDPTTCWELFESFFHEHHCDAVLMPNITPECDYLASGATVRGTKHMVVMRDGSLLFDPHPSNLGLTSVECIHVIVPRSKTC